MSQKLIVAKKNPKGNPLGVKDFFLSEKIKNEKRSFWETEIVSREKRYVAEKITLKTLFNSAKHVKV